LSSKHLSIGIILFILFLDQFSKIWIKSNFELGSNIANLGLLRLDFVENPGMAFGFSFGNLFSKYLLSVFRLGAVILIGLYIKKLLRTNAHILLIICLSLIFAGALGNILDNIFYSIIFNSGTSFHEEIGYWVGYSGISKLNFNSYASVLEGCVVDMIHLVFYWPEWAPFGLSGKEVFPPVFNIADASISISVAIILLFYKKIVRKQDVEFKWYTK